jgi:2-oxoisovalerate dehydrogenase E1 component
MEAELLENTYLEDSNLDLTEEEEMNTQEHTTNKNETELLIGSVNDTEQQIKVEADLEQNIDSERRPTVSQDQRAEIRKTYSEEEMVFDRTDISDEQLIHLYKALLKPRLIEDRMLIALRQGKISKWFSGYGQEAISVGIAEAIQTDEYLLPLHRNLGLFTSRKIELEKLFAQFQGKKEGFTKGRDRSFHFGTNEHHIVGMISHLGPQLTVANGIALADVLENKKRVTVTFTGDGGTSQGDFHEALNVAAVWDLPTIFVVENNGYGLSTPSHEQFRCRQFIDKGIGYGMRAVQVDGNNILEVYSVVKKLAEEMREKPHPVLLEMITFRMRGHEEASGTKYVPQELFEVWEKKDPVTNYEKFLVENTILTEEKAKEIKEEYFENIKNALDTALELPKIVPNTEEEIADMYAPHEQELIAPISSNQTPKRLIDAISDSLRQSMERYPKMTIMGQDVADYGGVFKITDGFVEQFGKQRVRNTPLCESAIVGATLGLSIRGWKSVMEMQFADFVTCGFNQIINNLAKSHYRWGQNADVVVRMPTGAGVAAGPFHSQSNEAWFAHTPGLKVVYPSSPYDAKGLLNASIEDPNPVIFFEHKALYRAISEDIYDDYYTLPIGKAALVSEGEDVSIITYGMGVHWAKKAAEELNKELGDSYSLEILDLRTLLPWDKEAVSETVKKTGKVIILHEDCLTGGIGGEISAWISEYHFNNLDAPIMREGSLDTAVPFSADLEKNFLPYNRFVEKLKKLVQY